MAHNFQLLNAAAYISKAGYSANSGQSPDAPLYKISDNFDFLTVPSSLVAVGTGTYTGSAVSLMQRRPNLVADGTVIFNADDNGSLFGAVLESLYNGTNFYITGIRFNNYTKGLWDAQSNGGCSPVMSKCVFSNCLSRFNVYTGTETYEDCIFINNSRIVQQTDRRWASLAIRYSIVWNSQVECTYPTVDPLVFRLDYSHVSPGSVVVLPSTAHLALINHCNIEGTFLIAGQSYTFAQALTAGLPNTNISAPANYNRPTGEDFTLRITSPHLDGAGAGIGPRDLRFALMYYIEFDGAPGDLCTAANTRLRSTTGGVVNFLEISNYTVNAQGGLIIVANSQGNFEASYTTDRIRVAATNQPIANLPVIVSSNFDSDYPTSESLFNSALPEPFNNNVLARNNFTSGQAGRNPHRLTIQARHSVNFNPDVTQSGDWNTGWVDYEINRMPTYNGITGYGNGHPNFDPTPGNVTQMLGQWAQVRVRQRSNYYSR